MSLFLGPVDGFARGYGWYEVVAETFSEEAVQYLDWENCRRMCWQGLAEREEVIARRLRSSEGADISSANRGAFMVAVLKVQKIVD